MQWVCLANPHKYLGGILLWNGGTSSPKPNLSGGGGQFVTQQRQFDSIFCSTFVREAVYHAMRAVCLTNPCKCPQPFCHTMKAVVYRNDAKVTVGGGGQSCNSSS